MSENDGSLMKPEEQNESNDDNISNAWTSHLPTSHR